MVSIYYDETNYEMLEGHGKRDRKWKSRDFPSDKYFRVTSYGKRKLIRQAGFIEFFRLKKQEPSRPLLFGVQNLHANNGGATVRVWGQLPPTFAEIVPGISLKSKRK